MDNKIIKKFFGTQEKLGDAIDVSQGTISDWVRGRINPSIDNAKKMIRLSKGKISYEDIYGDPMEQ